MLAGYGAGSRVGIHDGHTEDALPEARSYEDGVAIPIRHIDRRSFEELTRTRTTVVVDP